MPTPSKYLADFNENGIYHVYNRTSNQQLLFLNDENRLYFLKQYSKYLQPVLDTYCWNLQPNHFHFLVRIKPIAEIIKVIAAKEMLPTKRKSKKKLISKTENKFLKNEIDLSQLVEHYFRSFFQSYSYSFNKLNHKKGNVFYKPFKRLEVIKDSHFTQVVIYIHANAQKHQLCKHFSQHVWCSWHSILSDKPTILCKAELLEWFGGLQPFIDAHMGMSEYYYSSDMEIEDD